MAQAYLRRLSRWQAEQQRDAVADIHVAAYHGAAGAEYRDRQGFLSRFEEHVQRPAFDMAVADMGGLVGCAYGFPIARTGEWWSSFRGELPTDIEELTASGRTFLLAELMVLPAHRRAGIATRLGEWLLSRLETDLVVAAVDRSDDDGHASAAAGTLHAWGWSKLGELGSHAPSDSGPDAGSGRGGAAREVWIRRPPR
jgi:GNAT superfamily N-acetyltransferase